MYLCVRKGITGLERSKRPISSPRREAEPFTPLISSPSLKYSPLAMQAGEPDVPHEGYLGAGSRVAKSRQAAGVFSQLNPKVKLHPSMSINTKVFRRVELCLR